MPPPAHLFVLKGPHYKVLKELPSLQLRWTLGVSTLSFNFWWYSGWFGEMITLEAGWRCSRRMFYNLRTLQQLIRFNLELKAQVWHCSAITCSSFDWKNTLCYIRLWQKISLCSAAAKSIKFLIPKGVLSINSKRFFNH